MIPIWMLLACARDVRDLDGDGDVDLAASDTGAETVTDAGADTETEPETDPETGTDPTSGSEETVFTTRIDASSGTTWVWYSFQEGRVSESEDWTLAFQRYTIRLNGGTSGSWGVQAMVLDGADFEALDTVPAGDWLQDTAEAPVFSTWYDYDPATHVLTPADRVYIVREPDGDLFKMELLSYYDEAGNAGRPSFRWARLVTE